RGEIATLPPRRPCRFEGQRAHPYYAFYANCFDCRTCSTYSGVQVCAGGVGNDGCRCRPGAQRPPGTSLWESGGHRMYSMLLAVALTAGTAETPSWGFGCHGCCHGCCSYSCCHGCCSYGCCHSSWCGGCHGCHGCWSCHGCCSCSCSCYG